MYGAASKTDVDDTNVIGTSAGPTLASFKHSTVAWTLLGLSCSYGYTQCTCIGRGTEPPEHR